MDTLLPNLEARVKPHHDDKGRTTKLLAFAELTIGDAFVIKGIRILQGTDSGEPPFVVFPAEKGKGANADRWFDVAHPTTPEARAAATRLILMTYELAMRPRKEAA